MATLIKDLIPIPTAVHRGDFVLKLTEGVKDPQKTVAEYVVTDQLARCFDDALGFIHSALVDNTSKAAYLHGSFGTGKSHFMAMLDLILAGEPAARSIPELAPIVERANAWTNGKRFLLVPYHMIGARNMEAGILGGYADYIRRIHPDAPVPGVYLAEGLFADAQGLRRSMGDEAFFGRLNEGAADDSEWGELEGGWDAERFEAAVSAPPGPASEDRTQLVGRLVKTFFTSYQDIARGQEEAYISLDDGLSVISKHAAGLGYDAVILFLDELILWLASHAARLDFMHQEGQKLAKLVEAQRADRPIPLVSFVARQRDLAELVGENITGAERLNFSDALKHWEGRFHKITLEDRNLPKIAERRVLQPVSDAAREQLDAAFAETAKFRREVMDTLLTTKYDRSIFRQVYPFSPALVDTLVGVSSVLQRERTALKVMMLLLVAHRETLRLGDIVPVGDLFDVIAHGDEAFSQEMAIHFDNAKRLYHQKLLPLLESRHGMRKEEVEQLPYDDARRAAFRADDRLVKTLLLAALCPGVESLKGLNANRLAALNHGSIKTPVPGKDGAEVLRRCREWAAAVGEIKIGDQSANPSISVQLSGVDTESIMEQARREDNPGNRQRLVRQMLFEQLGIEDRDEFFLTHEFTWRHTERLCEIIFGNVRTLPESSLEAGGSDWKLVVDFPFDEAGCTPQHDLERLEKFRQSHPSGSRTICWIPSFFKPSAQRDLGNLVVLEHILTGERFGSYSSHLPYQDRPAAKALLENQRSQLRQRVLHHLEVAFGVDRQTTDSVDTSHELTEHFQSLWHGFDPQPPVGPNLRGAMQNLLDQALEHQFPAHPRFEAPPKGTNLQKVYQEASRATQAPNGRIDDVDKKVRPLLQAIAVPLLLGEVHENVFLLSEHWKNHLNPRVIECGGTPNVGQLRHWMNLPRAMGLPKPVENLLILVFAEQTNRTFYLHGAPADATLTNMPDLLELRTWVGPPEVQWKLALQLAGSIFGAKQNSPLLNASNVANLAAEVKQLAEQFQAPSQSLCKCLRERLPKFDIKPAAAPRMKTATAVLNLVTRLSAAHLNDVIPTLASAEVVTTDTAMGKSLKSAAALTVSIAATSWGVCADIVELGEDYQAEAQDIRKQVKTALEADEHAVPLAAALQTYQTQAMQLLARAAKAKVPPKPIVGPTKTDEPQKLPPGKKLVVEDQRSGLSPAEAKSLLADLMREMEAKSSRRLTVKWRIEEDR